MLELLSTVNLTQLLICVILIALAAKEFLTVKDFFKKRVDTHYEQKDIKETQIENILQELQELKEHVKEHEKDYGKMQEHIQHMGKHWVEKEEAHRQVLQKLVQSDMDAIKSFIVKEHHFFLEEGWIDDFSLDTIEKRYSHYRESGGNSYVEDLVKDLRELPNKPPRKE